MRLREPTRMECSRMMSSGMYVCRMRMRSRRLLSPENDVLV